MRFEGARAVPERGWIKPSVRPQAGHVHVFEGGPVGAEGAEKRAVQFVVLRVKPESIEIE